MDTWSGLYLQDELAASASKAAVAFAAFSASLCIGRLFAGRVLFGFGRRITIVLSGVGAAVGGAVAAATDSPAVVAVAFLVMGFAISASAPAAFGLVDEAAPGDQANGVAAVTTIGYSGFVWSPPIFGWIAQAFDLRAAMVEAIPGTFSYELEPVEGFRPQIAPGADYTALTRRTMGTVMVTLATVHDTDFGTRWGPAWVFFARDVCFATSKGDVVSPARSGNDACTDANMWVQVIDATSGATLGSFTAYERSERWMPERAGGP